MTPTLQRGAGGGVKVRHALVGVCGGVSLEVFGSVRVVAAIGIRCVGFALVVARVGCASGARVVRAHASSALRATHTGVIGWAPTWRASARRRQPNAHKGN